MTETDAKGSGMDPIYFIPGWGAPEVTGNGWSWWMRNGKWVAVPDEILAAFATEPSALLAAQGRAEKMERVVEAAKAESLSRRAMRSAEENQHDIEWVLRDEHEDRIRDLDAAIAACREGK